MRLRAGYKAQYAEAAGVPRLWEGEHFPTLLADADIGFQTMAWLLDS